MKKSVRLLRAAWLPLFWLCGISWLFAPVLYGQHYGALKLISTYEAAPHLTSFWFRLADITAGLLLIAGARLFSIGRRSKLLMYLVVAIGCLLVIDALFKDSCGHQALCGEWSRLSTTIHDVETLLTAGLLLVVPIIHAKVMRRRLSLWFVVAQLAAVVLVLSTLTDAQQTIMLQYVYELLVFGWLGWMVSSFGRVTITRRVVLIRHIFGWWVALNGMFAVVVALSHRDILLPLFGTKLVYGSTLIGQHAVVAGVLMLYLARHVYQGQRRAAVVLAIVFGSEVIKYSLLTPSWLLLLLNILSLTTLMVARSAFNRNIVTPRLIARAGDAFTLIFGVLVSLVLASVIATATGHRALWDAGVQHAVRPSSKLAYHVRTQLNEHPAGYQAVVLDTLMVAALAAAAWSLFRPTRFHLAHSGADLQYTTALLDKYATSSEDYFKLWPHDKTYFRAGADGFVAYRVVNAVAFALADPIGPSPKRVLAAFLEHCHSNGWSVCFLLVPGTSSKLYETDLKLLKIGSSAQIACADFVQQTMRDKWWRWRLNQARKNGLSYDSLQPPHSTAVLSEMQTVSDAWLRAGHSEQGFALGYFDVSYMKQCRLHVVRGADGRLLAFANELPRFGTVKRYTVDLIRYLPEHDGTMPYLLARLIQSLYEEDELARFDLGFVPLAKVDTQLATVARRLAARRFSSQGLEQFKGKFDPVWQSDYIAYDGDLLDLARIATGLETALRRTSESRATLRPWNRL